MPKMRFLLQPGGLTTGDEEQRVGTNLCLSAGSKAEQDLEKNKLDILKLAHEQHLGQVEFLEEVSGKVPWRKRQIATIARKGAAGGQHHGE